MAFILADRVKETTTTSGTGSVTLGNGFGAFQTFADGVGDGNQTYYAIENDVRWEVGIGTYTNSSKTLSRDTVLRSSSGGSKITLEGVSIVFATYPADKAVAFGMTNYGTPLTLGRTTAGNFLHAYVDNSADATASLHMTDESTPTWKLGLKGSPSSATDAPVSGYVYGTVGKAGLYGASDAYVFVDSNLGFYVSHESSNLLKITKDGGSVFTNASANVNGLTIKGASAQSYPLQVWANSAGSTLSAVRENGYFAINKSTASYPLDVNGTANVSTLRFADGTTLTTAPAGASSEPTFDDMYIKEYIYHDGDTNTSIRFQTDLIDMRAGGWSMIKLDQDNNKVTVNNSNNNIDFRVNSDDGTQLIRTDAGTNRVGIGTGSPDYLLDVDGTARMTTLRFADGTTQTTVGGAGWTVADGSGNSEAILDGQSVYFSGAGATAVTYSDSTNIVTVSGSLAAHPSISAASSSDNSGRTYIQDITLDSNGHVTGLTTATETVTDTTTTYYPGSGLTVDGTTFNVSGANTSTIGIVELTNTIDSLQTKALTPKAVNDAGFLTSHPSISAGSTSNNSGRTYIQDITLDAYGHVTALGTAAETVTDTTYTAGNGLILDGTVFNASGASLSHSGVILTANIIDSNSGVAATPYAITQWAGSGLPGIGGSLISTLTEVTSADADMVMIWDATDSALKRVDAGEFRGGGGTTYTAGNGLLLDGTVFNASGASLSHSGVIKTSNTVDSNSGVAITPYAVKAVLTNIEASGFVTTDTNTTYTAGNGLILDGTTFNASGASLSHSGVIKTSNTVDANSGVAITPYAVKAVLTNIEASGFVTTDTNTTYTAGNGLQLDGTVFNSSGASLSHSGVIKTSNTVDTNSGVAITPYAVYNMLRDIQGSGLITTDTNTTYTAGNGLLLDGTTFHASGASLSHSGVIKTSNTVDSNSGVAITPYAIKSVLTNIEASGFVTTDTNTTYTAGTGLILDGTTFNASGASLSHSGVIRTANIIDSNSGVAATPYAITQWAGSGLPGIDGSLISTLTEVTSADADMVMVWDATDSALKRVDAGEFRGGGGTTYTAGNGLLLDGTVFNASGASLSHSGVIKTSNTVDSNSGVAITPYAIKAVLTNIEGSGYITTDTNTTYTAGSGLSLVGTTFHASGATVNHSGVVTLADHAEDNQTKAITPKAVKTILTNIQGSGYITASSTDTLTNKTLTSADINTPDIDGGTVDGANITVGSSKTLDVSAGTLTTSAAQKQAIVAGADGAAIDNCVIGGSTPAAGTFTTLQANTSVVPDAVGGADLGSTSAEWGDIYIADDKKIKFGDGQDATIEYDEDGTDTLRIAGSTVTVEKAIIQPSGSIGDGTGAATTITVDWSAGNFFTANLDANIDTVQFQNVTVGQRILLRLNQTAATARTWTNNDSDAFRGSTGTGTSNADVRWAGGGTPPTITAGTNTGDLFGFICVAEAVYDGFVIGQDIK